MNILKSWLVWFCLLLNTGVLAFAIITKNYLAAAWIIGETFCFLNSERYFNELMETKKENIRLMVENQGLAFKNTILISKIRDHIQKNTIELEE